MNKILSGIVFKIFMNKTIIVKKKYIKKHKIYQKNIIKHKKYYIHDSKNICKKGDLVYFKQTKPISKTKKWILIKSK